MTFWGLPSPIQEKKWHGNFAQGKAHLLMKEKSSSEKFHFWPNFCPKFWLDLISSQFALIRHINLWIQFHKIPNLIFDLAPTRVYSSNLEARWLEWRLKIILMEPQTSSLGSLEFSSLVISQILIFSISMQSYWNSRACKLPCKIPLFYSWN